MKDRLPGRYLSPDTAVRRLPTPEEATGLYSGLASEALRGTVFDAMDEEHREGIIADVSFVTAAIVFRAEGRYRSTSPDVLWSGLFQSHEYDSRKRKQESPTGRFLLALRTSSRKVFNNIYGMLAEGVTSLEELSGQKKQADLLKGLRGGNSVLARTEYVVLSPTDSLPPLTADTEFLRGLR